MSSKENNEVAVEKIDNDKGLEGKCELKGTKRAAEVIKPFLHFSYLCCYIVDFSYWPICLVILTTSNRPRFSRMYI